MGYLYSPLPAGHLAQRLSGVRHVALDMDGTIYLGSTLFPFTIPFLNSLKRMGIGYSFLTNNPSRSQDTYLRRLHEMGIEATRGQMYVSSMAAVDYLREKLPDARRLFILGTPDMTEEFLKAGFTSAEDSPDDEPDAVVVGFDMTLTYDRVCRAAWWISQGKPYIATNPDRVCPTDQRTVLVDCGSICRMISHAVSREPDVFIGKPNPEFLRGLAGRLGLEVDQIAVVGDRIYTDIAVAQNAGATSVLVLSGETTLDQAMAEDRLPDVIAGDLSDFGKALSSARG